MASLLNKFLTNNINAKLLNLDSKGFINKYLNFKDVYRVKVFSRNFTITSLTKSSQKPNINIGTIGHIDHGLFLF
jgi:hypothetical protein